MISIDIRANVVLNEITYNSASRNTTYFNLFPQNIPIRYVYSQHNKKLIIRFHRLMMDRVGAFAADDTKSSILSR